MEMFLYFMSGLTIGIAMTFTYFDSKAREERFKALLMRVKASNDEEHQKGEIWEKRERSGTDRTDTNGIDSNCFYGNYIIYREGAKKGMELIHSAHLTVNPIL